LAVAVWLVGCGDRPFLRTDPPVAIEGLSVALVGQRCGRRVRRDLNEILDLVLEVRVANAGPAPVTIDPARFTLLAERDATPPDEHDAVLELAPGRASRLRVHFHRWGNYACNRPMALSLDGVITLAGRPLRLRSLSFVPEASDV
jgi:hypothetical protein